MSAASATLKIVFNDKSYVVIAAATAAALWVLFNVLDGLVLFSPIVTFYYPIPEDALVGFGLSFIVASLAGLVASMNVYLLRAGQRMAKSGFVSGSTLGTISSVCAGCSSVGFYAASTFGAAGIAASNFLANYQTPLRIIAIALLVLAYIGAQKKISSCKLG